MKKILCETINMNGRLYDPTIARFLSPDPYVANNTFTQDYNRYSYCRNNPLLYTDPSGEFLWLIPNIGWSPKGGVNIGLTCVVGVPGVMSAQASKCSEWGVDKTGWTFNPSVSVMIYPEHTTNLVRGQGFRSNNQVFTNFVKRGQQQKALEYFGFDGTYDPDNELFKKHGDYPAVTHPITGEIYYNDFPFEGNFDRLHFIADHEMKHRANVLSGKYVGKEITDVMLALEEVDAYSYNKRNYGLYLKSGYDIKTLLNNRINDYNAELLKININSNLIWSHYNWYDFIYKIPRLW